MATDKRKIQEIDKKSTGIMEKFRKKGKRYIKISGEKEKK